MAFSFDFNFNSAAAPSTNTANTQFSFNVPQPSNTSFSFATQPSTSFSFSQPSNTSFSFNTGNGYNYGQQQQQPLDATQFCKHLFSIFHILLGETIIIHDIHRLIASYNTDLPLCRFDVKKFYFIDILQHFVYNEAPEGKSQKMTEEVRKLYDINRIPEKSWQRAMEQNPDASKFYPFPVRGFQALHDRAHKFQQPQMEAQKKSLAVIEQKIQHIAKEHEVKTEKRIEDIKEKHRDLSHRLLNVRKYIASLML